jgi:hypothetical protein
MDLDHPRRTAMTKLLIISAFAALAVAGCATQGDQYAKADCKIAPITTASVTGKASPVDSLQRRQAEMDLAATNYRVRNLARNGYANNNIEEALRDCY